MRKPRDYEIKVFEDTMNKAYNEYKEETNALRKPKQTKVYEKPIHISTPIIPTRRMNISVVNDGTVNAGHRLARDCGKTAILNFADALVPGGLVLTGATTQEENICRCSNLYASITTKTAKKRYYDVNNKYISKYNRHGVYTDNLIYSKDVLFFKDDANYLDVEPYHMDVITCPAPSCKLSMYAEYNVIVNRIEQIIKSAIVNGVKNIVLGAWGCGAFGQDPYVVAEGFRQALLKYPLFDNVVFAIRSCEADWDKVTNYGVFKEFFGKGKLK